MNQLHPDLKRLLLWSRVKAAELPDDMPLGFSTSVLARWGSEKPVSMLQVWVEFARPASWVSVVVIICGMLFLFRGFQSPKLVEEFSMGAQFIASNLIP